MGRTCVSAGLVAKAAPRSCAAVVNVLRVRTGIAVILLLEADRVLLLGSPWITLYGLEAK